MAVHGHFSSIPGSGPSARRWPIVRLLHRTMFLEVGEDGADGVGFFDAGHDPHRTAAVDAGAYVDAEYALDRFLVLAMYLSDSCGSI